MPRIFDNIQLSLLPTLRETLKLSNRADFCVGYFNLRGWQALDDLIEQYSGGENSCCHLLIGMQSLPSEDLCVSGMLKNHCLAAAIADISPYEVRRQLEYKCDWYGSELVVTDRFFSSSQFCSDCGHLQKMLLDQRTFECQNCCSVKCRDWNASLNLERYPRLNQPRTLASGVLPTVPVEAGSKP